MIGAEERLISSVVQEPKQFAAVDDAVSGEDFADANLGLIYDGLHTAWVHGSPVTEYGIGSKLSQWGIPHHAYTEADVFGIVMAGDANPHEALQYAVAIRREATRRRTTHLGVYVTDAMDSGVEPIEIADRAQEMLDAVRSSATTGRLATKTLTEIFEQEDDHGAHDWVIDGLLEKGDRLVVTGHEGKGKSYFLRQLGLAPAAGMHPFDMTQRIDPVDVLVIDAENTERQWRRGAWYLNELLVSLGERPPGDHVHIHAGERLSITKGTDLAEIHRLVDKHDPGILVIGPLYKLTEREITTDTEAAPMIAALDSLRERGLVLLMEAHAGHGEERGTGDRALRPRGSSALMGWPEFGIGLKPVEGDDSMATLVHWRGGREIREWPKHIRHGLDGEYPWMPAFD